MGRTVAVAWHASFWFIAAVLYFFFVLPRWWELTGATPHVLGTVVRIVTAVLVALAALPVVFTWLRARKPEYGTPELALRLLVGSIVAQVLAGVLIAGTAISEIWLSLDSAGQWLFGIYGAAAAIALLGVGAFYLSFVAELPPPPPKPLTAKTPKQRRRWRKKGTEATAEATAEGTETAEALEVTETEPETGDESETEGDSVDETTDEDANAESTTDAAGAQSAQTAQTAQTEVTDPDLVASASQPKRRPSGKRQAKNR